MMRWIATICSVLPILFLATAGAAEEAACNVVDRKNGKIVNPCTRNEAPDVIGPRILYGSVAKSVPSVAAIRFMAPDGSAEVCTGVKIGQREILTAGHCACGYPGSYSISNAFEMTAQGMLRDAILLVDPPVLLDPFLCRRGRVQGVDLAVMRLPVNAEAQGENTIADIKIAKPVKLGLLSGNFGRQLAPGRSVVVFGYGRTETGSIGRRMTTEIPVLSPHCADRRFWRICEPYREMILADREGTRRRDTCGGDSGGPAMTTLEVNQLTVFARSTEVKNEAVLVAITSRAAPGLHLDRTGHCGGGGIYASLGNANVVRWLRSVVADLTLLVPCLSRNSPFGPQVSARLLIGGKVDEKRLYCAFPD